MKAEINTSVVGTAISKRVQRPFSDVMRSSPPSS